MTIQHLESYVPSYKGIEWQNLELPKRVCPWPVQLAQDCLFQPIPDHHNVAEKYPAQEDNWKWPGNDIVVFTDLHADGHAFVSSLVASGYIEKFGPKDEDFKLTKKGRKCRFIINGDCFDKGPSNLHLLRLIKRLIRKKARVRIIAGNHDIRFAIGMHAVQNPEQTLLNHLFIRMAPKGATFLKEIHDQYIVHLSQKKRNRLGESLSDDEVRQKLYPGPDWETVFRNKARNFIKEKKIEKEIHNVYQKQKRFEQRCAELGLSLPMAYAAINQWFKLFLTKGGEFYWFFKKMKLLYAHGSFLFMHAGIDDVIAKRLKNKSVDHLNKKFRESLKNDPFNLYYGSLGNVFRTKYRENDHDFTPKGAKHLLDAGYKAIVQGHCNRHQGQQLVVRHGLLNFECDASVDIDTRSKEGLKGKGAAATIIKKSGVVLGISVDYPYIKAFHPENEMQNLLLQ